MDTKYNYNTFARLSPPCSGAWVKQFLQMTSALFIANDALHMNIQFSSTPSPYPPPTPKKNILTLDIK